VSWQNARAVERRIGQLLREMTLAEKVGQLNQYSRGIPTGPGTGRSDPEEAIRRGEVGSFLNVTTAAESNALQRIAMEESRMRIPLLFGLDVIHGFRTTFPVPLALSATWDPATIERAARVSAEEATAAGVRWTFSPMVDVARDARWGRIVEGAGEDPYLGSILARAYVRGYQGERLSDPDSMAACVKHYVAYGAAEGGRDYNTVDLSEQTLREVHLPPFHAAVDEGVATLMAAFNTINGVPASANEFTLTHVLRREWGFRGLVVSDWSSVAELIPHGVASDLATAAQKALLAGVDMDMESNAYFQHLAALVREGKVPEAVVERAVRRILRVKLALGLFERPYTEEPQGDHRPPATARSQELGAGSAISPDYLRAAREAAEKSFVLLRNEAVGGNAPALPLARDLRALALIGPLADSRPDMLGPWSACGRPEDVVTLRAALAERASQERFRLLVAGGTEIDGASDAGFAAAIDAARQADVVLLALGEAAVTMTGEAASRAFLELPGNQQQLLEAVAAVGKPTVLVLFSGRPLALTRVVSSQPLGPVARPAGRGATDRLGRPTALVSAILAAWFPGVQAGPALVRVLFGDVNPSGRLTASFPRSVGQEPLYYSQLSTGRPATGLDLSRPPAGMDEKYRSRYIDEQNAPLFPFGFGLSYTTFEISSPTVSSSVVNADALHRGEASIRVSADVRNTGSRAGETVVQLYIRLRGTSVARPVRELKGYQRVALAPNETRQVEFTLGREELSFWNAALKPAPRTGGGAAGVGRPTALVVEPAELTIWVSSDSQSGAGVSVTLR
jgi:beta-glucosidase